MDVKEKAVFLINPESGSKPKRSLESKILGCLDRDKYDPHFIYTEYAGHGRKLATQLTGEGVKLVIAVGGDGTVNEVASALARTDVVMGIIPAGSGNGLARHLGISMHLRKAVEAINTRHTTVIDAGMLDGRWFFCTCGLGFDAHVGDWFARGRQRGFIMYVWIILREFYRYRPTIYTMKIDDRPLSQKAFLVTIANAAQYGNNAYIAPGARIDDGFLDVCIVKPFPKRCVVPLALKLVSHKIDESPYVEIIPAKSVVFTQLNEKHIFHFDGEPGSCDQELRVTIHPQVLRVITG